MTTSTLAVGDRLPAEALGTITRSALALYAEASGDPNPIHVDPDAARAAGLPDVIAHGMLSMAYAGRYLTHFFDQRDIVSLDVRFAAMTPVDTSPVCQATVAAIVEDHGQPAADLDIVVSLDDGTVTVRGRARVALRHRNSLRSDRGTA